MKLLTYFINFYGATVDVSGWTSDLSHMLLGMCLFIHVEINPYYQKEPQMDEQWTLNFNVLTNKII